MKSAFALIAAAGLVAAQNFDSLPACALGCYYKAAPETGCSLTDTDCLCRKEKQAQVQALAGDCLNSQCSAADLTKAENIAKEICAKLTSTAPATVTVTAGASSSSASGSSSFVSATSSGSVTSSASNSTTTTHHNTTMTTTTPSSSVQSTPATTTVTQTTTKTPNAAASTAAGALVAVVALAFAL